MVKYRIEEPHDFSEYGIEPLDYDDFKIKAKTIIKKFIEMLPDKLFTLSHEKFSLKSIVKLL
jgi:hypothetical protein